MLEVAAARYFKTRGRLLFMLAAILLMGVLAGSLSAGLCEEEKLRVLYWSLEEFGVKLSEEAPSVFSLFSSGLFTLVPSMLILLVCGFAVIGMPGAPVVLFWRGFVLGFCTGAVLRIYAMKAPYLLWGQLLIPGLLCLPVLLAAGAESVSFSLAILKSLFKKSGPGPSKFGERVFIYVMKFFLLSGLLAAMCLISAVAGALFF